MRWELGVVPRGSRRCMIEGVECSASFEVVHALVLCPVQRKGGRGGTRGKSPRCGPTWSTGGCPEDLPFQLSSIKAISGRKKVACVWRHFLARHTRPCVSLTTNSVMQGSRCTNASADEGKTRRDELGRGGCAYPFSDNHKLVELFWRFPETFSSDFRDCRFQLVCLSSTAF